MTPKTLTAERKEKFLEILEKWYQDNPPSEDATEFNKNVAAELAEASLSRTERAPQIKGIEAAMFSDRPVTEADLPNIQGAQIAFESAFGFGTLPWDTKKEWQKFSKWVATTHQRDPKAFVDFVAWRDDAGKYKGAMTNTAIRRDPQMFMDTGFPTFLAHTAMNKKVQPVTTDDGGLYV